MRSRTAWFSAFMPKCKHEGINDCETFNDFDLDYGNSDSSALFFLDEIKSKFHNIKIVIIKRDYEEALSSLNKFLPNNIKANIATMSIMKTIINNLDEDKYLVVDYKDINKRINEIWAYCIPNIPFDEDKFELLTEMNIQRVYQNDINIGMLLKNKIEEILCQ